MGKMNNLGPEIPWRNVHLGDQVVFVSLTAPPYVDTISDIWQSPPDGVFMNMKYFFKDEPHYNKMFAVPPADILDAAINEWNLAQAEHEAQVNAEYVAMIQNMVLLQDLLGAQILQINLRTTATHIGNLNAEQAGISSNQIEPLTQGDFEFNREYVRVNGDNRLIYDIDALEAHYNSGRASSQVDPLTRAPMIQFEIFRYIATAPA